jgi:hypothetical protein
MKRFITMGLAALAVSAVLVSAGAELRKGQKMPQTELTDLNGAKVQLGGKSGKIQIIDFWAVW